MVYTLSLTLPVVDINSLKISLVQTLCLTAYFTIPQLRQIADSVMAQ